MTCKNNKKNCLKKLAIADSLRTSTPTKSYEPVYHGHTSHFKLFSETYFLSQRQAFTNSIKFHQKILNGYWFVKTSLSSWTLLHNKEVYVIQVVHCHLDPDLENRSVLWLL